jgi:probable rRNA maturation factor
MNQVDIQYQSEQPGLPNPEKIQSWVDAALSDFGRDTEVVVRIVDEIESAQLNKQYRHKEGPTNVLSFPSDLPENSGLNLIGDLVICAPIVQRESWEQRKPVEHHWAHMIVHGVLHLVGFDHIKTQDAETMENKEIQILKQLNICDPYLQD